MTVLSREFDPSNFWWREWVPVLCRPISVALDHEVSRTLRSFLGKLRPPLMFEGGPIKMML